jgi:hypothetical protein
MLGIDDAIVGVSNLVSTIIDKVYPNPEDKAKAEAIAVMAQADAAINQLKAAQAVMLAEEQSADPWTSRARPSFLYVIYLLMLMSIPMGVLSAFNPLFANAIITGFHQWLAAIPEPYIELFGIGYLGYTGSRSFDKHAELRFKGAK